MSDSSVSSLSNFLLTSGLLASGNSQLSQLTQQLSTGQNETSLVGYGNSAQQVLNLASSTQSINAYTQSNSVLNTYLGAYNTTLTQLQKDTTTLQGALTAFNINDPTTVTNLNNVLTGVITDISATLNSQVGNRFIFGGTGDRMTTAPVVDDLLGQFAAQVAAGMPPTAPSITDPSQGFIAATPGANSTTPGTLPSYDTQYTPAPPPTPPATAQLPEPTTASSAQITNGSYATQTATVADNHQITFGISSNDPSIQALIYSAENAYYAVASAHQAQTDPPPGNASTLIANATTYVSNAEDAANTAVNGGTDAKGTPVAGLLSLNEQVGNSQNTLSNITAINQQTMANLTTQTSSLEAVNSTQVAEEISALENQLNASYKVTSSLMSMSLLNYL
jgi:flagellar hook-associated protein 3 FlgL